MPDAKSKSILKGQHRAERELLLDKHRDQKAQLSNMHQVADKRAKEQAERTGIRHKPDIEGRVKAHAEMDSKHRIELKDLNAKHAKEMEDHLAGKPMPANRKAAVGGHLVKDQWGHTDGRKNANTISCGTIVTSTTRSTTPEKPSGIA